MKTHIRILTLLLAFCLLLPAAALPALGQEDETSGQPQTTEEVVLRVAPHPGGSVTVTGALAEPELETDGTYAYRFAAGSAFTLTLKPDEGKAVSAATLNDTALALIGSGSTKTYAGAIEADATLRVTFTDPQPEVTHRVTVTVINSSGKAVLVRADGEEVLGSFAAVEGSTPKISIETETGCAVSSVTLTDSATGKQTAIPYTGEPFTLPAVTADCTLTILTANAYFITVSSASNGSVSPSSGFYAENSTVELTLTPNAGYVVDYLLVDGEKVELTGNTYSHKVTGKAVITAYFKKAVEQVEVTVKNDDTAGSVPASGYTIKNGKFTAEAGSRVSFTVKPNTGYVLDGVTIDGEAVEVTDNSFVASIRADAEVVITYKKAYRITAIVSEQGGGRITVDEPHTLENMFVYVAEGDRITFTFTPDMGYEIDYVKIDGSQVTLTSDNKYTITDVKKAYTISVVFKHTSSSSTTYSVYASAGANGSISPSGRQTVAEGASLTFTITPNTGYEVDYVQVDGTDVSLTDGKYEFKNIAGNHTINVYFKQAGTVSAGAITKDDVDWTKSPIEISFETTTVIDKSVFDTILSEHQTVEIVMKSSEYEYYFPTASVFTLDGSSADMKILRNGGSNYSAILALLERKSITGENCVLSCPQTIRMPEGTKLRVFIGASLAKQTVQLYVYKDEELTPVSGLLTADASGWVTVENYGGGDLVFVRTDVGSYTVAVIVGENGSVDPSGNVTAVRGESLEFRATAAEGYVVESVKVDGVSMDIEQGKSELTYTLNVLSNHTVEFTFVEGEAADGGGSNTGLIISIVVIILVLAGGGVLFYLKWRQSRF